jgi:CO/xanthine dehydrogenase FAD-binding subunit
MKPPAFSYIRPESLEEALEILAVHGSDAAILAGGQSLIPALNFRIGAPELLVDINPLIELAPVEDAAGAITIGALARHADLLHTPAIHDRVPVVAEAARLIGHTPIRNRGTAGGSIAHADPAAELPAVLAALDGTIELASTRGTRIIPFPDFALAPYTTARQPDELLVGLRISPLAGFHWACWEVSRRSGDFALAGCVAGVVLKDGAPVDARIALFGTEPTPRRIPQLEAAALGDPTGLGERLRDASPDLEIFASDDTQQQYRHHLALIAAQTAVERALDRATATS